MSSQYLTMNAHEIVTKVISMSNEMKNCPYCGEEVLAVAKKCKHCSSEIKKELTTKSE